MADEKPVVETVETAPEVDVDALPEADFQKLKRGEEVKPKAKQAEADDDGDGTDEPAPIDGDKSATVPHGKFHRANERAKAETKRATEAEARANLAMQRMTELLEASKPKEEVKEPDIDLGPDPTEDPLGYLAWDREQKRLQGEKARTDQKVATERQQQNQAISDAVTAISADYETAKADEPQIEEAYNALQESYANELKALGWRGPQLQQKMQEIEMGYILYAHQNKLPIADVVKSLAQARFWKPKVNDGEADEATPRDAAGRFKAAAAELDKREATKRAAKSLNGTGGTPAVGAELTPKDILDMSEEDFAAFKKKYGEKAMAKAFGYAQ